MDTEKIIGSLRSVRIRKGYTQENLSDISGVTRSLIARYETEKKVPNISTLDRLLHAMGYTLSVMIIEEEKELEAARKAKNKASR